MWLSATFTADPWII